MGGKLLLYAVSGSFTLAKTCSFQAFSNTESEKVQIWERSVIPILSGLNKSATLSLYLHPSPITERSGALVHKEGKQVRATLLTPTHFFTYNTFTYNTYTYNTCNTYTYNTYTYNTYNT